jgi:hypothetical protein
MAKKAKSGEVSRSAAIRDLIKQKPHITVKEAIAALGEKGIKINQGLFYTTKGRMQGKKSRHKKARKMVENVTATMSSNGAATPKTGDVISTILKVKHLAAEVGGLKKLNALVDALGE